MTDMSQSGISDHEEDECCPPIRTYEIETTREDQCCDEMFRFVTADDLPVTYFDIDREWGIAYPGDSSTQRIRFCPWCGSRLPASLYEERQRRLRAIGIEPSEVEPDDPRRPAEYRSDRWWKDAEL